MERLGSGRKVLVYPSKDKGLGMTAEVEVPRSGGFVNAGHGCAQGFGERKKCRTAGQIAARRGYGQPNLGKPSREWDAGGLSFENQWNLIEECIYGANESSKGVNDTEFCQSQPLVRRAKGSTGTYWQLR